MKNRSLGLAAAVFAAAVVIAYAADASVDYDHHVDFGRFHTYSWLGVQAGNSLWQDRITQAVDAQLTAKGWQKVASGGDAAVAAVGRVTERDNLQTFYDGFPGWGWGGWRGWGGGGMGMATTTVEPEKVGTLSVNIFQAGTKQLIWRGTASDVLSSKADKNDKRMDEAVEKMFKKFPPAGKD